MSKVCTKCNLPKPLTQFSKKATGKDGLTSQCKGCVKAYRVTHYAANLAQYKAKDAKYRAENPEKIKVIRDRWIAAHPEQDKAAKARWEAAHPENVKAKLARYRATHREELNARNHQRRAVQYGVTAEEFLNIEIFDRDGWVCQLCETPIDRDLKWPDPMSVSLDHIMPITLGGHHTRANSQAAHFRCNQSKGNRVVAQ